MSLVDPARRQQLAAFRQLQQDRDRIVAHTKNWMDNALRLHASLSDQAEKQEVVALRAAFIADLKAALGIS